MKNREYIKKYASESCHSEVDKLDMKQMERVANFIKREVKSENENENKFMILKIDLSCRQSIGITVGMSISLI